MGCLVKLCFLTAAFVGCLSSGNGEIAPYAPYYPYCDWRAFDKRIDTTPKPPEEEVNNVLLRNPGGELVTDNKRAPTTEKNWLFDFGEKISNRPTAHRMQPKILIPMPKLQSYDYQY